MVINPNQEDTKSLFVLASVKNKIKITKIRIKSHLLHSERGQTISKT